MSTAPPSPRGGPALPVKVAHVTLRFDAPGGVETTVRETVRRLRSAGDDVTVYSSDLFNESGWERRSDWAPQVDGVPVRRFPAVKRPFPRFTLPVMPGLVDALVDSHPDVIHAHSHRYGHVLQSSAVASREGIPIVISTHYHPADARESAVKRGLLRLEDHTFGALAYRTADAIVVESETEARLVRQFAPVRSIRTIPPGIDLAEWSDPDGDRAAAPPLPSSYFVFVGRVAPNKGLPQLVDAWAGLPALARPSLALMGRDWGMRARVAGQASRLGLGDAVHWLDHVADARAYRAVIRKARALVLPSEWEAYGLVLLDAMAAGTPVVATSVGAVPEVLDGGRAGRLVPYGDVAALTGALRSVLEDPAANQRFVDAGRERVRGLDWSVAVERHRALYRDLTRR
ncbi:MAG TPA: glycosyltransferase family 4 protein [Thermoplasmata archaeon]|nr:glycosyltransferase family 4 protein [Thermoplasmata archaeon]